MKYPVFVEFKQTGINEIYIDNVCKMWSHLWMICEWRVTPAERKLRPGAKDSFRLVKMLRKDSQITQLKLTISDYQARQLITRLDLTALNVGFKGAWTWRRKQDWGMIYKQK